MTAALLFDLDGTLAATDHIHFVIMRDMMAEHDVQLDEETFRTRMSGMNNADIAVEFLPHVPAERHAAIMSDKEARFRRSADMLTALPGLVDLLDWAKARGVPCAVVTNAPAENAEFMLAAIGLTHMFDVVVLGDDCERAKPFPDPYLVAMAKLGARAERCVAFEDSRPGLAAAIASGAATIGLTTTLSADEILACGADLAAPDFACPGLIALVAGRTAQAA